MQRILKGLQKISLAMASSIDIVYLSMPLTFNLKNFFPKLLLKKAVGLRSDGEGSDQQIHHQRELIKN